MRQTKIIAFSVPKELESMIHEHADAEHRTVSEYIREALRHYMTIKGFTIAQKSIARKLKKKGLKPSDVNKVVRSVPT